ncbi:class I SAM-dependent DNA methyltransferase [Coralliovum pocilloporae]|uniref:class I SAM-dependent DNA methyltransferase n=1 Tax=Coralliovum pocilloporae TaxID=3066369 RepID=UPI003306F8AE
MTPKTGFLDNVYDLSAPGATETFYGDWAATYEQEVVAQNGYVTPGRCAAVLAEAGVDPSAAILDMGCGTGLAGLALRNQGFKTIDGLDFSAEMLAEAAKKDGLYRHLATADLSEPITPPEAPYHGAVAAGVINPGHAPVSALKRGLDVLEPDGVLVFSLNDKALKDPHYEAYLDELLQSGACTLFHKAYGDHLPGQNMGAFVYGLRKTRA